MMLLPKDDKCVLCEFDREMLSSVDSMQNVKIGNDAIFSRQHAHVEAMMLSSKYTTCCEAINDAIFSRQCPCGGNYGILRSR